MNNQLDIELLCNDEMVCPYCRYEQSDSWECLMNDKEDGIVECGNCVRSFNWHANHTTTYDTSALKVE